ncbi:hypothetical protein GCK72_017954 [Caenorhabditis remanei]|uniref:Uncharacterized protein n=1 Tax=Caenorhabditis remanei TaxID=31234 RepID=A0A6A5G8U7_CAERE|nr:hypothetical protein GCK72_017954 [Caenorhabditis remanei]KAF1751400.1 hypothetical protein GCK72_017954 [Caenorhabditis remanei]
MINRANPILCPSRFYPLLLIIGLFLMLATLLIQDRNAARRLPTAAPMGKLSEALNLNLPKTELSLKEVRVKTHRGLVSLDELNENVFKKYGYEIISPTVPVPTLKMIKEPTCGEIFSEWQKISEQPQPEYPPKEIPAERKDEFLLYNYAAVNEWYFNDKNSNEGERPRNWDKLSEMITWPKEKLGGQAYGTDGVSMYNAMKFHRLDGKSGVVIGSMQPWVEVSALVHGAAKVLTVEYNNLTIQAEFKDRMSSILPINFVKNWETYAGTFDFAASFSSIEHSGLGRYGDPMDPIGDLREMLKIKCILKPGGLLFLGFPLGTDAIQYNAHRIYGSVRLAMMFYGFEWLGTFSGDTEQPNDLTSERLHSKPIFGHSQNTIVLRKL